MILDYAEDAQVKTKQLESNSNRRRMEGDA